MFRKLQWTIPLRHCLLCMTSVDKGDYQRVYCGLSDGNLTMIDVESARMFSASDLFCWFPSSTISKNRKKPSAYPLILRPSLQSLFITINYGVWHPLRSRCSTKSNLPDLEHVSCFTSIYCRTYDIISYIHLTERPIDCPTIISARDDYIWILLRSRGNTLQAWHPSSHQLHATICLNKVFDRIGKPLEQLAAMKEMTSLESNDDEDDNASCAMNEISISSFLIHDTQLWIGTTMGILYVFEYGFTSKIAQPSPRSICRSYLAHILPVKSLPRRSLSLTHERNSSFDRPQKSRSQSDSRLWVTDREELHYNPPLDCLLTPVLFDQNLWPENHQMHSTDSVTTLTSVRTRSSSSAILSTDDSEQPALALKHRRTRSTTSSASAAMALNLTFKAKIADTPVKCICRTK